MQKDAQATHQHIAQRVHLSASQVSRRIQRLTASGLVRRQVALLDAAMLGLGVRAITYVSLTRHSGDERAQFEKSMAGIPEVLDCYSVTGESDYILQILTSSLEELSESVLRRLTQLPGVSSIRSNLVLQSIKSTTEVPLGHVGREGRSARRVRLA